MSVWTPIIAKFSSSGLKAVPDKEPIYRFAPSPNGRLHLGHAYSALLNQCLAETNGGSLLLRVENIDLIRCTTVLEQQMLDDLAWLGIKWSKEPLRQSDRLDIYREGLDRLASMGLVYPAFMTRSEIRRVAQDKSERGLEWPNDPDGTPLYPPNDRQLTEKERIVLIKAGRPYSLRLNMQKAVSRVREMGKGNLLWKEDGKGPKGETGLVKALPDEWGDIILAGKDAPATYHLACVLDDGLSGVTHIVRGRDLFWATSVHRVLQVLLGLPEPRYFHHDLVPGEDGKKLSKSRKDTSLAELRAAGVTPNGIRKMVGLDPI